MFKKLQLLILVFTLGITASAQEPILQQFRKSVAFVYGKANVKDQNGNMHLLEGALGTAFFVWYPEPRGGKDYGFVYIVTAKHVLKDEASGKYLDKIRIRLNQKNAAGVAFGPLTVSDENGNLKWFDDKDDSNADVAATLCEPDPTQADYRTIPLQMFADADFLKKQNISEGDQVYLIGLMPQFTGENRNYPIVRHGYIALLADEPIPLGPNVKEKVYALELGSWPGQSGSPVFLSLGGLRPGGALVVGDSYSLLGLMLGYFPNERPFETVTTTKSIWLGDSSNVGISFVLPATEILKVLNSNEAQAQRDADLAKKTKSGH